MDRKRTFLVLSLVAAVLLGLWVYFLVRFEESHLVPIAGHVVDSAGMIDLESVKEIDSIARGLHEAAGVDLVVVTVPFTRPWDTGEYTQRLLRKWEGEHPDSRGGVLVLVTRDKGGMQGAINVEISPSLAPIFPRSVAEKILEEKILPAFVEGNKRAAQVLAKRESPDRLNELFGRGLLDGARAMAKVVTESSALESFKNELARGRANPVLALDEGRSRRGYALLFVGLVAIFGILLYLFFRVARDLCPECGGHMAVSEEVVESPTSQKPGLTLRTLKCPACLCEKRERVVTFTRGFWLFDRVKAALARFKEYRRRRKRRRRRAR